MSSTERLRAMLDEHGITNGRLEYEVSTGVNVTAWDLDGGEFPREREASFTEFEDGGTLVRIWNLTPEQAIAATLGAGTCKMEFDPEETEVIAHSPEDTWAYRCSVCLCTFRYDRGIRPKFCPWCGAHVVEVDE